MNCTKVKQECIGFEQTEPINSSIFWGSFLAEDAFRCLRSFGSHKSPNDYKFGGHENPRLFPVFYDLQS
jgi:hypothetical protein